MTAPKWWPHQHAIFPPTFLILKCIWRFLAIRHGQLQEHSRENVETERQWREDGMIKKKKKVKTN